MRQKITLICSQATILLLVMLLTSVSAWAGSGETYVVDANGGGQYTSISAAVSAATGGETISIKNGEYTETSKIDIGSKQLSFIGESQDGVIIHSGNNDLFYTQDNGYSSISIRYLTFKDISMTGGNFPIFIGGNGSVTIDHCTFDNCASAYGAIRIFTSGSVTINNCTLMNTKSSIGSYSSAIDFGGSSISNYTISNTVIDGSSISDANTANFIWGVIYNEKTDGTVTLDNVTIRNCNLDKAVGLIATKGNMTIKNSTIVNNYVYGNDQKAGFIFIDANKTVTIETSMILNNRRPNNFLTSNNQFASFNLNYNNIQGNTFNTAFTKSGNTTYTLDANYWGANTLPTGVTASTWVVKNNQGNYELNNGDALPAGKSIPECSHSSLTAHPAVAVTCLDNGNSAYWQCNTCGTYFSDDQGSTIIPENSWVIPATGHTLNKHEEVPATCTTAGSSAYWECSNCHKYFSDAGGTTEIVADSWVIDALGHTYENGVCTQCRMAFVLNETDGVTPLNNAASPTNVSVTFSRSFTENVASTICLPFEIDATQAAAAGKFYTFAGVNKNANPWEVVMQETPTSNKVDGALTANTPYLFKPSATGPVSFQGTIADITGISAATETQGDWSFIGTYARRQWDNTNNTDEIGSIYGFAAISGTSTDGQNTAINAGSFFRVAGGANSYIVPFRAYMKYTASGAPSMNHAAAIDDLPAQMTVRLVGSNGETTAIGTLDTRTGQFSFDNEAWYTLDGRRLDKQPTAKGLYIHGGKKHVIR